MYLDYFGFRRFPFTIAPDPDFLFPSKGHQEALAHLQYALTGHGGLICLTGEVGTGKTTLCRRFLTTVPPKVRTAYLFNPQLTAPELLQSLCDELGFLCPPSSSLRDLYRYLNDGLLRAYAAGEQVICVIDEAQAMPADLLEQVRLLTNLETSRDKLLTVILVGQPELRDLLQRHDLRQLNQRITARYHLNHLSLQETADYLNFRAVQAGGKAGLFSDAAVRYLWKVAAGVPRMINTLADRALLGAYASEQAQVSLTLAKGAATEVLGSPVKPKASASASWSVALRTAMLLVLIIALPLLGALGWQRLAPLLQSAPEAEVVTTDPVPALVSVPVKSPVALLTESIHLPVAADCDVLPPDWQCLWLDWPLPRVEALAMPFVREVRLADGSLSWKLGGDSGGVYTGHALLLWQGPANYDASLIRPGESGPVVAWVRERLNAQWSADWQIIGPNGVAQTPDDGFYDPLLAEKVGRFQQRQGLPADRILGPQTLLYLSLPLVQEDN